MATISKCAEFSATIAASNGLRITLSDEMKSIRELYRIGTGPSSSHTMGPRRGAEIFRAQNANAERFRVTLFGSLASTGKGHLTDVAVKEAVHPVPLEIIWKPDRELPLHPNGMIFEALTDEIVTTTWQVYSIGGGDLLDDQGRRETNALYGETNMSSLVEWTQQTGRTIWEYVAEREDSSLWDYLTEVWMSMKDSISRGIPCIERNAFAATRALDAAGFALLSDGVHHVSFDEVVETMMRTGTDLAKCYRETSTGGLAVVYGNLK